MSVRVIARIRPLLKAEIEKDIILTAAQCPTATSPTARPQIVRMPNPKKPAELYSFQFNGVYEMETTQQEIFDSEGMLLDPDGRELVGGLMRDSCSYGEASLQWV